MTKPRAPEFTDYATADAYLGKTEAKATHDAWNTKVTRDPTSGDITMWVSNKPIAVFRKDNTILLQLAGTKSGTERERVNRYILGPRGYEANEKWMVSTPAFELPGTKGVVKVGGASPLTGAELITPDGKIDGVVPAELDKAGWNKAITKWLDAAMDQLTGPGLLAENVCVMCSEDDWWDVSSVEHLMSHVMEPTFPGELLVRLLSPNAELKDGVVKFTGDRKFTEEATRRWMLNELNR